MDTNMFSNDFKKYLKWICIFFLIILFLPILLTKFPFCISDFSNTGPIGDTIGGIMGPFVAIAAAILTFLAFWVQFKANEQQRKDIALERFESNLFQLIQIQEDITNNLQFLAYANSNFLNKVKISGRQIFKALYEEKYTPLCGIKDDIKERGIISYEVFTNSCYSMLCKQ